MKHEMTDRPNIVSGEEYFGLSQRAGYQYSHIGYQGEDALFQGRIGVQSLSCGIDLCASELLSIQRSEHEGVIDRSFTIAINLHDDPIQTEFGDKGEFYLPADAGAVVAAGDAVRMASQIEAGARTKSLLLRVNPDRFADDAIAEEIYRILASTDVINIKLCARSKYIAREIADPSINGAIGRILTESAALELLARTLISSVGISWDHSVGLKRSDFIKLKNVRDLIETYPFREYSLAGLASEAGMSLSALKAKFPIAFGKTVFAFISEIRLNQAYDLLAQEGWAVSKVSHHIGYSHQSSFTAAFKKRFGISPASLARG